MIQIGRIGLIKADQMYDESKGLKFTTYAVRSIRNMTLHGIRDNNNVVRFSSRVKEQAHNLDPNLPLTIESVMEQASTSKRNAKSIIDFITRSGISTSTPIGESDDGITLEDTLPSHWDVATQAVNNVLFQERWDKIPERPRTIFLLHIRGMKQAEICEKLGLAQSSVSRNLKKATQLLFARS
jgi:RNA polymerase sigma factor (sigma-70 family)